MNTPLPLFNHTPDQVEWPDRPRILLSYWYARRMTTHDFTTTYTGCDILLDSGAFSVHNSGKTIDHDAYLAWVADNADHVTAAFTLDVIGDPVQSARNHEYAAAQLAHVDVQLIPTWHIGSEWRHLEALCEASDYVAIGGAVKHFRKQSDLYRIATHAHDIAARHNTRLHGLGMTGRRVMYALPWASVDSTSWKIPSRMPLIYLADRDGRRTTITYGRPIPPHHAAIIRQYGGNPAPMEVEGFSMARVVGSELARARQWWGKVASARSDYYVEARKRWATGHPFKVYLAADAGDVEPIIAHRAGNPWADTPPRKETAVFTVMDELETVATMGDDPDTWVAAVTRATGREVVA